MTPHQSYDTEEEDLVEGEELKTPLLLAQRTVVWRKIIFFAKKIGFKPNFR